MEEPQGKPVIAAVSSPRAVVDLQDDELGALGACFYDGDSFWTDGKTFGSLEGLWIESSSGEDGMVEAGMGLDAPEPGAHAPGGTCALGGGEAREGDAWMLSMLGSAGEEKDSGAGEAVRV